MCGGRAIPERGLVSFYHFRIFVEEMDVGHINFRVGDTEHVRLCAGHIGYGILESFSGHGYALQGLPRARALCARCFNPMSSSPLTRTTTRPCAPSNGSARSFLDEIPVAEHDPHYAHGARA